MRVLAVGAAAMALAACSSPTSRAHQAIVTGLRDPKSAQFTSEMTSKDGVVCGFVNARNALGAYAGPQPYMFDPSSAYSAVFNDRLHSSDVDEVLDPDTSRDSRQQTTLELKADCEMVARWQSRCAPAVAPIMAVQAPFCRVIAGPKSGWRHLADRQR